MATTEADIFDRLATSFRSAAECCDKLAVSPKKGPTYRKLRDELRLIEGAARQAGHYREDARWFVVGIKVARCHQTAGDWLRSHAPAKYFTALATALRNLQISAEALRTTKVEKRGAILPKPQAVHRDSRAVGWRKTDSGLLIPSAA